jgi:hypothetical protein
MRAPDNLAAKYFAKWTYDNLAAKYFAMASVRTRWQFPHFCSSHPKGTVERSGKKLPPVVFFFPTKQIIFMFLRY